jgi:hypothetical protein
MRIVFFKFYFLVLNWSSDGEVISMIRGSIPGLVIGIFLKDFNISTDLAPSSPLGPLSGESTFHYHQFKKN